jgi:tetratricopeptide (TPR) repeat protein
MRLLPGIAFLLGCGTASAGSAPPPALPNPPACADFKTNKTGTVDAACNAAIAAESDPHVKSVLLLRRAFVADAVNDPRRYAASLDDLNAALKLYPENYYARHERAYLYERLGRWAEARADLDAQLALTPGAAMSLHERAVARAKLGDLQGAYADRDAAIKAGDTSPEAYIARAQAALWLGRFDAARSDAARAQDGDAQSAAGMAGEVTVWETHGDKPAEACDHADASGNFSSRTVVGDCTAAFLAAPTPKDKAAALTIRAQAWLVQGDNEARSARDLEVAAALDPGPHSFSNLGFAYLELRHPEAAIPMFEKSIAAQPAFYNYAGLALAKLDLGDIAGAEAAARKSNELHKNDMAMLVLGDAAFARTKRYDEAKAFWLQAYQLGNHGDDLAARLKQAGVPLPKAKP